jgi:hypothetical protein
MLWHFTAEYTPQGDIGKFSDDRIEAALDWTGKKGHLIDCLVESGWLDREPATTKEPVGNGEATARQWPGNRKLVVHHWHDHAEDSVRKRLNRAGLQFLTVSGEVTGQNPVTDRTLSDTGAVLPSQALPEPEPTPPNPPGSCASDDARVDVGSPLAITPRSADGDRPEWFEQWWAIYWRKVARKPAQRAFQAHVRTQERFAQVMAATIAQTPAMTKRDPEKRPHGATWLNAERWNDEPSTPATVRKPLDRQTSVAERTKALWAKRLAGGEKPI